MDATILAVFGTGIALFGALWKVQGHRFDMAEKANHERFKMAEKANHERFEALERRNAAEHAAICQSIEKAEKRNAEEHADIRQSIEKADEKAEKVNRERFETLERRNVALDSRFDTFDGRFDALYRHLLDAPPRTDRPGGPGDKQESAP